MGLGHSDAIGSNPAYAGIDLDISMARITPRARVQRKAWRRDQSTKYVMLCYTGLTSAFGTITVPRRRGIGPMQLRRKCYVMLCYTCLTSAFGTITVPRRRGIGPMQLRRKWAHPCCSRRQQTGTGLPSKPGTHQASSARESKPGPAHPHRAEVKMQDAASTRDGKQACYVMLH
jgi:hypothetical protein